MPVVNASTLQLVYNGYVHTFGEPKVSITRNAQPSSQGTIMTMRENWKITGILQAIDLKTTGEAITTLEEAYGDQGADIYIVGTPHGILSQNTLGGVRVTGLPAYPTSDGAELSTYRTYDINVEADVIIGDGDAEILEWEETLIYTGGGPRFVVIPTLYGEPIKQTVCQSTSYRCTQSGYAKGFSKYPDAPEPYYDYAWHQDQSPVTLIAPTLIGTGAGAKQTGFGVRWNYEFEDPEPLTGAYPQPRDG